MLCSWFFLSVFPCRAAGSCGRFRSASRRRGEWNRTVFLVPPFISSPPPAADCSPLVPLSCLRLFMTEVWCLWWGRAGGLDPFTRSLGGPVRFGPTHVTFLPRPSFSPTLRRRGRGVEGDACAVSMATRWPLSEVCSFFSRSLKWWDSWWWRSWEQSEPGFATPSDWVVLSNCVCRTGLVVPPSLIGSEGSGSWHGAESQSLEVEVLGGDRRTSSLSPNTDTRTHTHHRWSLLKVHHTVASSWIRKYLQSWELIQISFEVNKNNRFHHVMIWQKAKMQKPVSQSMWPPLQKQDFSLFVGLNHTCVFW